MFDRVVTVMLVPAVTYFAVDKFIFDPARDEAEIAAAADQATKRALDVSHILEGSVRRAENQVRIAAQLIDAHTDMHLWSETYDETLDNIFAVQDKISIAVADRLHLQIFSSKSPHEGVDLRAYELFLRASVDPAGDEGDRSADVENLL